MCVSCRVALMCESRPLTPGQAQHPACMAQRPGTGLQALRELPFYINSQSLQRRPQKAGAGDDPRVRNVICTEARQGAKELNSIRRSLGKVTLRLLRAKLTTEAFCSWTLFQRNSKTVTNKNLEVDSL